MFKKYETQLAGRNLSIETGKIAELANGSVVVRYGETVVMVNVTAAKEPKEVMDRWLDGKITANAAMGLMGLRRTTFYKLAKLYKEGDLIV